MNASRTRPAKLARPQTRKGSTRQDPGRRQSPRHARTLAGYLDEAAGRKAFERLVLVLPPKALGLLRGSLSSQVAARVTGELDKDFTNVPLHELADRLETAAVS